MNSGLRRWALCGGLGCAIGIGSVVSPGFLVILGLVLLAGWLLSILSDAQDRRFILLLFGVGFAVRAALSLGLDATAWVMAGERPFRMEQPPGSEVIVVHDQSRAFLGAGDSDFYSIRGYGIAQYVRGVRDPSVLSGVYREWSFGWSGYQYVIGLFYFVCGYSPIAVKLLNGLLGALIGPMMYFLARAFVDRSTARWAGVVVTGVPSLLLWSATNLRDIPFIALSLMLFLLFLTIRRTRHPLSLVGALGLFGVIWLMHATLKSPLYSVTLVGSLLLASWLAQHLRTRGSLLVLLLLGGMVFAQGPVRRLLAHAFSRHIGHVLTPGIAYQYLPDRFYEQSVWDWANTGTIDGSVLLAIGRALGHYLLEPFPWRVVDGIPELLAYPQTIWWYGCLPFVLWGLLVSVTHAPKGSLFLILTVAAWMVLGALTSGNIGTVFRVRDLVLPYLVLFACVGARRFVYGSQGVQWTPAMSSL